MGFLRNAWYPAAWDKDVTDGTVAIRVIDHPIVLFRDAQGQVKALFDACPHRFAPLSRGKVRDGRLVCGYHGLEFGGSGACLRNPHGKGAVSSALSVRSYPVAERYGMLWVWMGEPSQADESKLPVLPLFDEPDQTWVHGQLDVNANYELVVDNLLDLTHVEFLHPFLASPGNSERTTFRARQDGDQVNAFYDVVNEPITGLFRLLWDGAEDFANLKAYMHWQAPANLSLQTGMSIQETVQADDPRINVMHLLVPQSEDATRYFWAAGRNKARDSQEVSGMLHYGTQNAFVNEDEPMIAAVRSRMRSNDLLAHKPALLPIDEAAIRARRILKGMIDREQHPLAD
ncbi:aromatic ring-hydroxylating dioxygenase subunit alpha [Nitrospirillum sp. BR 11828]|uniref:aromatic ring-hydroxylating dioxygenase subunit alpha n=1 Tax=Nitrospirillum sp. BR 11828 TaxID=3104325 RepID=UPI002ACA236E|nr:aromatic ring-hydroxylating dioxygenase subunit alpha [Nitrospirillum sp. BR 11828]MDZ5646011.1 aromatic ring-hydroxylating dioxygenase subunit alpha [Nitrospirillum sp. BR 11828]